MDITVDLSYDPITGLFTWVLPNRTRGRVTPGSIAGHLLEDGYTRIVYKRKSFSAHRLAFLFMTGSMPEKGVEVDHRDGDRSNNRWDNLRLCNKNENQQNGKLRSNNTSGLVGACRLGNNRWVAQIGHLSVRHHLGVYATKEEAHAAYMEEKQKLHTFNPIPYDYKFTAEKKDNDQ